MQGQAENIEVQPPEEKSEIPSETASSDVGVNPVENTEQKPGAETEGQVQQSGVTNGGYFFHMGEYCRICGEYFHVGDLHFYLRFHKCSCQCIIK